MVEGIVNGIIGGLWHALIIVPWQVWLGLALVVVVAIAVLRLITDPHISLPAIALVALVILTLAFRAHYIDVGRAQMQAKVDEANARVAAYYKTNGLVIECYNRNRNASYLWDRTQGKCLRTDGAIE